MPNTPSSTPDKNFETFPIKLTQLPHAIASVIADGKEDVAFELQRMLNSEGQTANLAVARVGQGGFALNPKTGLVGSPAHQPQMILTIDQMKKLLPPELFEEFKRRGF